MDLNQEHNQLGLKYVKFSTNGERESRDFFISEANKAIKLVQHLATSVESKAVINEDWQFQNLVDRLDHIFLHGLKNYLKGYLVVFKEFTHPSVLSELSSLRRITTNIGKSRAWLLHGLKDHLLESYLQCLMARKDLISRHYEKNSIFFDFPRIDLLIALLSGLEHIEFNLQLDIGHLDMYCCDRKLKPSNASEGAESADQSCSVKKVTRSNSQDSSDISTPDGTMSHPPATLASSSSSSSMNSSSLTTGETFPNSSTSDLPTNNADDNEVLVERIPPKRKKRNHKTPSIDKDNSSTSSGSTVGSADVFLTKEEMKIASLDISTDNKLLAVPESKVAYQPVRHKSKEAAFFEEQFEKIVFGRLPVDNKTESYLKTLENVNNNVISIETTTDDSLPFDRTGHDAEVGGQDVPHEDASLHSRGADSTSSTSDCTDLVDHGVLCEVNPIVSTNRYEEQHGTIEFAVQSNDGDSCCRTQDRETRVESIVSSSEGCFRRSGSDRYESVSESVETIKAIPIDGSRSFPTDDRSENSGKDSDDTDFSNITEDEIERRDDNDRQAAADNDDEKLKDSEHSLEYKVSNNLKVLLLLDVFTIDGETLLKAFEVYQHFTDGKPRPHLVVIASSSVYFFTLKAVDGVKKIKLHFHILYSNLASLSIGLNGQTIDFVLKSRCRYNICTGNPHLTRLIVEELKLAIEQCQGQGKVTILSDATNQKIAIKRWAGNLYPNVKAKLATIESYNLVSYHVRNLSSPANHKSPQTSSKIKKGNLFILAQVQHMHGIVPMWKKAFFVLKDKFLCEYEDETLARKTSTINLSQWSDCKRCNATSGKKHCFALLPSPSGSSSSSNQRKDRQLVAPKKNQTSPQLMPLISFLSPLLSIPHNLPYPPNKKRALLPSSLPSVHFSSKTKEEARDWSAALKSVIKSMKVKKSENRLKHGCCIIMNNALHICHQNPTTCAVQILTYFSLDSIISVTHKDESLTLLVDAKGLCDVREELEQGFEIVQSEFFSSSGETLDDVRKVGSVQSSSSSAADVLSRAVCRGSDRVVSEAELDGQEKKLVDIFFCTVDESLKFASTLKSCFSTSGRDVGEIFKGANNEDEVLNSLIEELEGKFKTHDWNSAEGLEASLK